MNNYWINLNFLKAEKFMTKMCYLHLSTRSHFKFLTGKSEMVNHRYNKFTTKLQQETHKMKREIMFVKTHKMEREITSCYRYTPQLNLFIRRTM